MPYTPFDLTGKVALVTGGNGGIGLGMAAALARADAHVVLWGTNPEKNARALAELESLGSGKVVEKLVDVSDETAVREGIDLIAEQFGRLDAAFANAGVGGGGVRSMQEIDEETYRRVLAVNLDGVFYTFRQAARQMLTQPSGGSLVGISSVAAVDGAPRAQHYAASKGAVIAMVKGVAVEYGRKGIRCNAVLPGWIRSDMTQGAQDSEVFTEKVISRVPAGRWGEKEDFGGIAVYLASDASVYQSGSVIVVDGGYTVF
ncbi:MAG: SDR family oxidoreductase [Gammaproteobacteria bacterium AqS3]|nr:SDR family oxidoreductase [Gammaproteobacteria bacterium AqS3]